jgi:DNA mismatch repair protein MutL
MGQIKVLDQNMINMIAAGEVIERPASVVKELVENSIDVGATRIAVSVEDGGKKLISVTDNGGGMNAEDLASAFEPHSTSKIKTTADLHGISTLGFRGEALASIASIAQVRAVSRMKDSTGANCIEIDCGSKGDVGPCSGDFGTTIQIRDIFYKLPARRKFLRTANTEMGHITEQFSRIALANENLDLMLIRNGKELFRLSAKDDLCRRIAELFPIPSSDISENLIEAESGEKGLHIHTLMGKPLISRTNNRFQYVFLNGRFIRDKFISHAIKEAYRGLLEPGRFPVVFLFIKMPFEDYDVNVHPTKIEVRFYNANLVHSQILGRREGCRKCKAMKALRGIRFRGGTTESPMQWLSSSESTDRLKCSSNWDFAHRRRAKFMPYRVRNPCSTTENICRYMIVSLWHKRKKDLLLLISMRFTSVSCMKICAGGYGKTNSSRSGC